MICELNELLTHQQKKRHRRRTNASVAQLDRASRYERGGQWFESFRMRNNKKPALSRFFIIFIFYNSPIPGRSRVLSKH
jgi:hypothetical protein